MKTGNLSKFPVNLSVKFYGKDPLDQSELMTNKLIEQLFVYERMNRNKNKKIGLSTFSLCFGIRPTQPTRRGIIKFRRKIGGGGGRRSRRRDFVVQKTDIFSFDKYLVKIFELIETSQVPPMTSWISSRLCSY